MTNSSWENEEITKAMTRQINAEYVNRHFPFQLLSGGFTMPLKLDMGSMRRMMRYMEYANVTHKRQAPFKHWYLQLVGVALAFQGKGYAGALLKPMFARMDREQLPCYLETFTQKDVSIYQHYGFEVAEEGTIPGTETALWAMLRQKSG